MHLNKRFFYISILLIVITGFAATFSQRANQTKSVASIFIKSGELFPNEEIKEFFPWGLSIDSNKTIIYKVISKITTNNKYIVDELSKNIDSLKISLSGNTYTVDIANAKFKWEPATSETHSLILTERSFFFIFAK
jgi:hypothetical protein